MTETAVIPYVGWQEIQKLLPRIQIGEEGESRTATFMQILTLSFEQASKEYVLSRSRFGYMLPGEIRRENFDQLQGDFAVFLTEYYQGELRAAVESSVYRIMRSLAEQIPYPQDCICADAEHGLMADDCHIHNYEPMHFFGDMEFPCTCDEQNTSR